MAALAASLARVRPLTLVEAAGPRVGVPFAVIEEPVLTPADVQGWRGLEVRVGVVLTDEGVAPTRLRTLIDAVEAAAAALGPAIGDWRATGVRVLRSRVARKGERWTGTVEIGLRLWRAQTRGDGA